jgi:hypothetical protein
VKTAFVVRLVAVVVTAGALITGGCAASRNQSPLKGGQAERPLIVADQTGRFALAWLLTDLPPASSDHRTSWAQLMVTVGRLGSRKRRVEAITSRDREPHGIAIVPDANGGAIVSWTDTPAVRFGNPSHDRWSMVRVDRAGNVSRLGQFDGVFESVQLARAPTGQVIAAATESGHVVISTLTRRGEAFSAPISLAATEQGGLLEGSELRLTGRRFATVLWSERYYPSGRSPGNQRLRSQRVRFSGAPIGSARTITPPPRSSGGVTSYVGHDGREAIAWTQFDRPGLSSWVRVGRAGHLGRALPLVPRGGVVKPQLAFSRDDRLFVVAGRNGPRPIPSPPRETNVVAGWIGTRGLRQPLALTHGQLIDGNWRAISGGGGGLPLAVWADGSRIHAVKMTKANRLLRARSIQARTDDDFDAIAVDAHRLVVAYAPLHRATVKIRVLHL